MAGSTAQSTLAEGALALCPQVSHRHWAACHWKDVTVSTRLLSITVISCTSHAHSGKANLVVFTWQGQCK